MGCLGFNSLLVLLLMLCLFVYCFSFSFLFSFFSFFFFGGGGGAIYPTQIYERKAQLKLFCNEFLCLLFILQHKVLNSKQPMAD